MTLNPIAFACGDQTAAQVALLCRDQIFGRFPTINVPCDVEQRLATNDGCIGEFIAALKQCGSGVKISTATDDGRIEAAGLGSANIKLRAATEVVGMFRMIETPKGYRKSSAILRYGSGGFYSEESCKTYFEDGKEFARVTSVMNISNLRPFAELAMKLAKKYKLDLRVSSKWTIADSEKLFSDRVIKSFNEAEATYEKILTDVAFATLATKHEGGWLWLFDNPNGDSAADIVDFVDGSRSMCSTVFCLDGTTFEELPGGTAPDKLNTDLKGKNFFNPVGIINAFCTALAVANPDEAAFFARVHKEVDHYLCGTEEHERSTYGMVQCIAERLAKHELV
jgi:isocitrate/isopropylmalate dehydrogenase